jgi:RNA polymerase sigma factor (sigma-70 family)
MGHAHRAGHDFRRGEVVMRIGVDNARCEAWISRGTAGDEDACRELVEYLWPIWLEMVRSSRGVQALVSVEDGVHDVIARLVEKLGRPEARSLVAYFPWKLRNPDKAFEDWLRIVTKNTIRDYLRERVGAADAGSDEPSAKRLLNEFASSPVLEEIGVRPPLTLAQTARELLEFARGRLSPGHWEVLQEWLKGASFEEIASELGLEVAAARQDLRAAVAVLRRYFDADKSGRGDGPRR